MAQIFLSHASTDKDFVRTLAVDLRDLGHRVWLDEWDIQVGDSIVTKVEGAIDESDFVVVILSNSSAQSRWVETEWQAKYWSEIGDREIQVLPALIENCKIPALLRPKKYADFRTNYKKGLVDLAQAIQRKPETGQAVHCFTDFNDIGDEWSLLFRGSAKLDLLLMYGATWRNTYRKDIQKLLLQPGSLLRVVLPEIERPNSALELSAERLGYSKTELRDRVALAASEFSTIANAEQIQLYATTRYFTYAAYLFAEGGVLALYSFKQERVPTPAFVVGSGQILEFLQTDFDWLVCNSDFCRRLT